MPSPLRPLLAIVYPWRDDVKDSALWLRWCLHLAFWTGVLGGLWYLNRFGAIERVLRSPWPVLHRTWLPLVGLFAYVLGWLARGLWLSLRSDAALSDWPDLDATWTETQYALQRSNIAIRETPLFVVLGPLTPDVGSLLESLGAASMLPRAHGAFRVFAHSSGIFVVCESLSHLGLAVFPTRESRSLTARLQHLCDLIRRDRGALKPIQGIALVTPLSLLSTDAGALALTAGMKDDLSVIRRATGLEVPLYIAISGLDASVAGAHFQRFPLLPDLDPADVPRMLQEGVDRLCLDGIAARVLAQFKVEVEPGEHAGAVRANVRLYQWICSVRAWRKRLHRLLVAGTQTDHADPAMVAGCYILGPGTAQTLWHDMVAHQQTTAWTAESLTAYAEQRRRTLVGYGAGLLAVGLCLAVAGWSALLR